MAPAPAPLPAQDSDAVFRAFSVFASGQKTSRYITAATSITAGGAAIAIGALTSSQSDSDPKLWYITGGILAGVGALGLFIATPAEKLAMKYRTSEGGHSPEEARVLEEQWRALTKTAARSRKINAAVGFILSGVAIGTGVAIAAGSGDYNDSERIALSSVLIAGGAAGAVPSAASFFVKGSAERAYDQYVASKPVAPPVLVSLAPTQGGFVFGAAGSF